VSRYFKKIFSPAKLVFFSNKSLKKLEKKFLSTKFSLCSFFYVQLNFCEISIIPIGDDALIVSKSSKLEILGIKYGIKVIYCPKYHCELNSIQGLWCYLKQYVRKRNVHNYLELHNLIREAMISYQSSDLNFKLWKRFWKALNEYKNIRRSYTGWLLMFATLNKA
jgi:hypothetical protein